MTRAEACIRILASIEGGWWRLGDPTAPGCAQLWLNIPRSETVLKEQEVRADLDRRKELIATYDPRQRRRWRRVETA